MAGELILSYLSAKNIKPIFFVLLLLFFWFFLFKILHFNGVIYSADNRGLTREHIARINRELIFKIEITNFKYASWNIEEYMKDEFEKVASKLRVIINKAKQYKVYDKMKVIIIGYSDADGPYNKKLNASKKRALSVMNFLIKNGFDKRIFSVYWRADKELKDRAKPKSPVNRRVLVIFEGLPIPVKKGKTGDDTVDKITRMGFRNIRYFNKKTGKQYKADENNVINIKKQGVIHVKGEVISYLPGDEIFVRVRNIDVPVRVNDDGSFEADIVVYRGVNYVTFIQTRGKRNIRRSDIIKVVSSIPVLKYQFQLKWDGYGDLDLWVEFRDTAVFFASRKFTQNMGKKSINIVLDVDNRFSYGPENIRVYDAPKGMELKVSVDYFNNVPWKNEKWFYYDRNDSKVNYTLFVFDGYGKLIKTIHGVFPKRAAVMPGAGRKLLGIFKVKN